MVDNTTQFEAPLPNHCSGPINGEIVMRGERHSGTNWIRKIMSDNLVIGESTNKTKILMDSEDFGWKHGFLYPDGWGKPISENEFLVIITRDVFTWLPKMFNNTYDHIMNRKRYLGFSKFIREESVGVCHEGRSTKPQRCREFNKKRNSPAYEKAANIIQLRTLKYKQWLSNDPAEASYVGPNKDSFVKNRIHIRLESLTTTDQKDGDNGISPIDLQRQYVREPLRDHCVLMSDNFTATLTHTNQFASKYENVFPGEEQNGKKKIDVKEEKRKLLEVYSKEDLRYVLDQLDLDFEKQLGYDYGYIHEMLRDEDSSVSLSQQL